MKYLPLLLIFTSCSYFTRSHEAEATDPMPELQERISLYCSLSADKYVDGYVDMSCDSAGFTALHGVVCEGLDVSIFEDPTTPGKLCRKPGCPCFVNGEDKGSKSNWSKDMEIMTQLNLAVRPNPSLVDRRIDYGNDNQWVVCDAIDAKEKIGRCQMSSKLANNWTGLSSKGSLTSQSSDDALFQNVGFQAHLDVISVLASWKIYGAITGGEKKLLENQAKRQPNNGLYQAAWSRFGGRDAKEVARLLLDKFPGDRLPNESDWSTDYLYQRDEGTGDWLPGTGSDEYYGTDFLLAAWVLTTN